VAAAVGQGTGLSHAAGRLGVSLNTARFHLQRIFEKTGTRRQAELVRTSAPCPLSGEQGPKQASDAPLGRRLTRPEAPPPPERELVCRPHPGSLSDGDSRPHPFGWRRGPLPRATLPPRAGDGDPHWDVADRVLGKSAKVDNYANEGSRQEDVTKVLSFRPFGGGRDESGLLGVRTRRARAAGQPEAERVGLRTREERVRVRSRWGGRSPGATRPRDATDCLGGWK
jgi:hypothetical protein